MATEPFYDLRQGPASGFKFSEPFLLCRHEPGDMGWVVHRHRALYARNRGYEKLTL